MGSSEKRVREVLRWLLYLHHGVSKGSEVDHHTGEVVPLDVTDDEWKAALGEAGEAVIASDKTDLERLVDWLHSRWGDYDVAGPDSGPLTSDQIRRFVIDEVLQYIADEFNVKGKEESDETG